MDDDDDDADDAGEGAGEDEDDVAGGDPDADRAGGDGEADTSSSGCPTKAGISAWKWSPTRGVGCVRNLLFATRAQVR